MTKQHIAERNKARSRRQISADLIAKQIYALGISASAAIKKASNSWP